MTAGLSPHLERHQTRRRSRAILRWLVGGLVCLLLPLGLIACLDSVLVISPAWRWVAFFLTLGAIAFMGFRARRARYLPNEHEIATLLDASSSLKNGYAITTAAELTTPVTNLPEEAALLANLHDTADRLAAQSTPIHPGAGKWGVGALAIALVLLACAGPHAVLRMLQPWQPLPYTTLTLTGPTAPPAEGEPFTVSGNAGGRMPGKLTIHLDSGGDITVPISADGHYAHTFNNGIAAPITLITTGGRDGKSAPLTLAPRFTPRPATYEHIITPLAYSRLPQQIEKAAGFTMLRASEVRYGVSMDRKAAGVRLKFDDNTAPFELAIDPAHPELWVGMLPVITRTVGYHLESLDSNGQWRKVSDIAQIIVTPDHPPVVEITDHNAAELESPKGIFSMKFSAKDDLGLSTIRVLYQSVGESEWKVADIALPEKEPKTHADKWMLPLEQLNVLPFDLVTVIVQARDNNTFDGPGIGSSEPLIFEIPEEKAPGGGSPPPPPGDGPPPPEENVETVNPLAVQRGIYKETLRRQLGYHSASVDALKKRQDENIENIQKLKEAMEGKVSPEVSRLIGQALPSARQASLNLDEKFNYRGNLQPALTEQAKVIRSLASAARLLPELKNEKIEPPKGADPTKKYTLKSHDTEPPESSP
ncbi:MAG TPA: hypothetical protein VF258_11940, partial [Luteolibacter sp.]